MLSEAEELRLSRRFRNEDDVDAARQMVLPHMRLVVLIKCGYLGYVITARRPDYAFDGIKLGAV